MSDEEPAADGGRRAHTVRLELADEPGELLRALRPIADHGGNLLSVFHERGHRTPRGRIPVEVDLECPPDRFDVIVEALQDAGVNVVKAGSERYDNRIDVLLIGHLIDTDLSDTLSVVENVDGASVVEVSVSSPEGTAEVSSARVRLAIEDGRTESVLGTVRDVADRKDLRVIEPLVGGEEA